MESLRLLLRSCLPRNVGRTSEARPTEVLRQARPSRPSRPPRYDRTRRLSPMPSAGASPANTSCAFWPRPMRPPLNPGPSARCGAARGGQAVILGATIIARKPPFRFDPALGLHAVERRIERAFFQQQRALGGLLDGGSDGVTMLRAPRESLQYQ